METNEVTFKEEHGDFYTFKVTGLKSVWKRLMGSKLIPVSIVDDTTQDSFEKWAYKKIMGLEKQLKSVDTKSKQKKERIILAEAMKSLSKFINGIEDLDAWLNYNPARMTFIESLSEVLEELKRMSK